MSLPRQFPISKTLWVAETFGFLICETPLVIRIRPQKLENRDAVADATVKDQDTLETLDVISKSRCTRSPKRTRLGLEDR